MNILLWILQGLLAAHTLMGAIWKFSTPAQNLPSLAAIPPPAWLGLSLAELLCVVGLILPAFGERFALAPLFAAGFVALEMLLYCGLHLASGDNGHGQLVYWLVVASLCGFIIYGRASLAPM